jgi:hypothetical protein
MGSKAPLRPGMISFALFAWLWALSGLLDIAPYHAWFASPFHTLSAASCVVVLLRPLWLPGFAAMHVLRIASFAWDSPDTANHQLLYAIASAAVLLAFPLARRGAARGPVAPEWLERFAPGLRVLLFCLYFFGVLHKLNRDYFDPMVSCAVGTFVAVAPDWLDRIASASFATRGSLVAGSLLVECAVPFLLAFGRTRRAGIALGALFHGFLGLRFFAFSTGLLALYSLFVPSQTWDRAAARLAQWRAQAGAAAALLSPASATAAALLLVALIGVSGVLVSEDAEWAALPRAGFPLLAVAWILLIGAPLAWLLSARDLAASFVGRSPGRLAAAPLLLLFPAIALFHGFSPYLGLRTVPAFSMFSNLRTEGGITNHWFMPSRALRIAGFQEDLITMLSARDEELLRFARRPRRTFYDLRLRIQRMAAAGKREIALSYRRGGEVYALERAETDPELMRPVPWWQRKWLKFRPVPISAQRECAW